MTDPDRSDNELLLALRHPLRRRILCEMDGKKTISPSEVAARIEIPVPNVAYHVRVLAACAAVTLVDTKPARGALQHFYRSSVDKPWAREMLGLNGSGERPTGESSGGLGT